MQDKGIESFELDHEFPSADLRLFKLSQHPDIQPRPEGKKEETSKYNAIELGITSLDGQKDAEGNDTFVLCDWWRCNSS